MNRRIIGALVAKDLKLFFRNRFFAVISVLGLVFYALVYFVMPDSVDETLEIALYAPQVPPLLETLQGGAGLAFEKLPSEEALKEAVSEGSYLAGLVLPGDMEEKLKTGQQTRVHAYFGPQVPQEAQEAVTLLLRQFGYLQSGQRVNIHISSQILGQDMLGQQVPPRDRLRPMIAVMLTLAEMLGLASLISEEVVGRTLRALLITPVTVLGLFVSKGITGVTLAFGQATLVVLITGGLSQRPLLILTALLLGAVLVTGIGFLLASLGKDLMSVMAWGVPVLILLSLPSFGIMFPGMISDWVKLIPSYYLVDTVHRAASLGLGWGALGWNLLALLGFDLAFMGLGVLALGRKLG